ncbi:MAG: tRNA pseudouridine(55) synthase TruB [Clostridia bacterium]|nr:tRNA pseudouridine(55) synthase TruB [Clostridia bacterium]
MTGFIILDKPEGITSFIGGAIVRRVTGEKKTGHTGTLDPMATGVLPVAVGGNAPRFIELLPSHDKGYRASFKLGTTTDTLDITGTILTTSDVIPDEDEVKKAIAHFQGEIEQLPPMYSAIKKDGKRLYELARQGIEVEREKRIVTIYNCDFVSFENEEYTIDVKCSKGTYIRSLISDIGEMLGCGAVMTALRRTLSNGFSIEDAHTEEELKKAEDVSQFIIPVDKALEAYPAIKVSEAQAKRFRNGGELDAQRLHTKLIPSLYRVYSPDDTFLGLGEFRENETNLFVKRVLVND